jgi:hypothetical protein
MVVQNQILHHRRKTEVETHGTPEPLKRDLTGGENCGGESLLPETR